MKNIALKQARRKLKELLKKYDGFSTVFFDDWRGFRFIYDIGKKCDCKNGCSGCPVYKLLKDETEKNGFTAGLYVASPEEKELFGPKRFLNCKNFEEYQDCFMNFLLKKCSTEKEIRDELSLVKNVRVLYSKEGKIQEEEQRFRKGIIEKTLANCDEEQEKHLKK